MIKLFILILAIPGFAYAQNFDVINEKPATLAAAEAKKPAPAANALKESQPMAPKLYVDNQTSKYTLGATDVLEISVMRHPEVSGKFVINSEGKIQLDFVGDIDLTGMTKEDAAVTVAKSLETYIIKPEVTVKIMEYNSKVVYVVGEVGMPGKIFMRGDTITVRDALLAAGLPHLTAATDVATLFTPSADGKVVEKRVNVHALLYKGDLRENYVMNPGDTIYLPATLWAKVARFINPVTQPVSQAAGAGRMAVGAF